MQPNKTIRINDDMEDNNGSSERGLYGMNRLSRDPLANSVIPFASIRGRSKVWNEFVVTSDGKKVTCKQCGESLAYSNSHSTSSMIKHLKRKHQMDMFPGTSVDDPPDVEIVGIKRSRNTFKKKAPGRQKKTSVTDESNSANDKQIPHSIQHDPLLFNDTCVRMKWTDHSDILLRGFPSVYSSEEYCDVTIVAEEEFFKAHRVILSCASEFFEQSFRMTPPGQHPIIFLKDVKAIELRLLIDYIYKGEVAIPPSLIPNLVSIGGELKVKGLSNFTWNESMNSTLLQRTQPQTQPQPTDNVNYPSSQVPYNESHPGVASTIPLPVLKQAPTPPFPPRTLVRPNIPLPPLVSVRHNPPAPKTIFGRVPTNVSLTRPSSTPHVQLPLPPSSSTPSIVPYKRVQLLPSFSNKSATREVTTATRTIGSYDSARMSDAVMMVASQDGSVMSTSVQPGTSGTATTSISVPLGGSLKSDLGPTQTVLLPNEPLSHPITILTGSGIGNPHELAPLVYSISEVTGSSEVLISDPNQGTEGTEAFVVYDGNEEKKFL